MKCPECGGDMHPVELSGWAFGRELLIRVLVCMDAECRLVVIVDWRWAAQEATR